MAINQRDIDQAFSEKKATFGGTKEDYFGYLHLQREYKLSPDQAGDCISFGSQSLGVNGYHVDEAKKNLYLFIFKWSNDHKVFKDSFKSLTLQGLEQIFGNPSKEDLQNQFLRRIRASLNENQSIINKVYIYFVFNGDPEVADKSNALAALRESLEAKKHILDQYFESRNISLTIDYRSNLSKTRTNQTVAKKTYQYTLPVKNTVEYKNQSGYRMFIAMVPLVSFHKMYLEMGYRLFDRNIRAGLSIENSPNRSIKNALKRIVISGEDNPENFIFHHNGIALSVANVEWNDNSMLITEPRVLNGAQTVSSLGHFLEEQENNKKLESGRKRLNEIYVLTKVIDPKGDENFVTEVTVNNNRQNPVEPWNLRASDPIQLEIADKFAEELNIFYERQENAFGSLSQEDLEDLNVNQQKSVEIKRFAQTLLSMQGNIDKINSLRDVFESSGLYNAVFNKKVLQADCKGLLLLYKANFRLNAAVQSIIESGPNKYFFVNKGKNLIWALLLQALMNDPKWEEWKESYGVNIAMETNYKDLLKDLAIKKVRLLVSDLIAEPKLAEQIQLQKYNFLRTKATYDRAMEYAVDRFAWVKKSL